jgi:hypothetical protein
VIDYIGWTLIRRDIMAKVELEPAYRLTKHFGMTNGMITKRVEPIRPNEILYDHKGQPVAIKTNGKILAIIEGDL